MHSQGILCWNLDIFNQRELCNFQVRLSKKLLAKMPGPQTDFSVWGGGYISFLNMPMENNNIVHCIINASNSINENQKIFLYHFILIEVL